MFVFANGQKKVLQKLFCPNTKVVSRFEFYVRSVHVMVQMVRQYQTTLYGLD